MKTTLTKAGRATVASAIASQEIFVAWGAGDGMWITPPVENLAATGLISEVGRHLATTVGFVTPDPAGLIVTPDGNFSASAVPTPSIQISVNFESGNSSSAIIREVGIFLGTVRAAGLPATQTYFLPAQIANFGRMLHMENRERIFRTATAVEAFTFILTF